jgi:hypothetical protein
VAALTQQARDDLGIQCRAAACDALGRVEELVDGEHTVL